MTDRAGKLVVVVGPTAAGKSDLALAIARWFDGEVVSADAFQVYRGLDIGTAKVGEEVRARVPHHCIDLVDPDEHYDAGHWARAASDAITAIQGRGRMAVVAGGSGFYVRALIDGLAPLPRRDRRWREALGSLLERRGLPHLYGMLAVLDPQWAEAVGATDRQRVLRGLEVTLRAGRPMSVLLQQRSRSGPHYDPEWIGVTRPRELLYARIERRVDRMLAAGWVQETERLLQAGYDAQCPGLRAIGYRDIIRHLGGELTLQEARDHIVRATRRYAKRQLTWFRGQSPAPWYELESDEGAAHERFRERLRQRLRDALTC